MSIICKEPLLIAKKKKRERKREGEKKEKRAKDTHRKFIEEIQVTKTHTQNFF